ncbi:aminopeptidase N-like [Planococcus citri]|uniref:aminopeptidase N-like n=1 Tax=Planococcus citri TaxID=170843 RepID=UPI0031F74D50
MRALKNFRLLSSAIIIFFIVIIAAASPFRANPQDHSTNLPDLRDEEPEEEDVYRLPNDVVPVSYELKIAPDLTNFRFAGQVNITVHTEFTTDEIILHSKNLNIENVTIRPAQCFGNATIPIPVTHTLDEKNEIIVIKKTSGKFKSDSNYQVSIKFQGTLAITEEAASPEGFYPTSYEINNETRWLAITQFEAINARKAFPCFDEPRFRTPFTIYLARSKNHIAISNMPNETTDLLPADSMSNGLGYEKFQPTPPMPTYLVAFSVSDFELLEDPNQDRRIRVITRPNSIKKASYALNQASRLLPYFEGYFGVPYPLPKLDIVAVPGFPGGMENWGMTTYGEQFLILDDEHNEDHKMDITTILSHELSHLWFGDLVTPAWYDYLWLKEGFASYFEHFTTAVIEPTWNVDEFFDILETQHVLTEEKNFKRAVTWPIRKRDDIDNSFDTISYYKGGVLIRMFEQIFSTKTFKSALHRFLEDGQRNQQGVVGQKNLFDAFDEQVELDSLSHLPPHVSASDIMKTWSENTGYPLITVTRSYERGEINITQTPYPLLNKTTDNQYYDQKWIVPLTFTTKSQLQFSNVQPIHWSFADEPTRLTRFNESEWILFNLKRSGYYRLNYDSKNWQLITDQLNENHTKIHEYNRAQLIDDVFTLTEDQLIDCEIARRLLKYLRNESSILPWYPASEWFLKLISSEATNSTSQQTLKNQLKLFLKEPLKNIGCESSTDNRITRIVKARFSELLETVGINNCAEKLSQMYRKNYNNVTQIPQNLKSAVFCNVLRYTNDTRKNFEHLWRSYRKSNKIYEKKQILESIFSCTKDEEILKSILSKIIDPKNKEISQQDVSFILKDFPSEIPTVTATIKFIDETTPILHNLDGYNVRFLKSLLNSINSKIQTEDQVKLIQNLEIKFESSKLKKYAEHTKMVKNLRINAEQKIRDHTEFMNRFSNECFLLDEDVDSTK